MRVSICIHDRLDKTLYVTFLLVLCTRFLKGFAMSSFKKVMVIGAGVMGSYIAYLNALRTDITVYLFDQNEDALEKAKNKIEIMQTAQGFSGISERIVYGSYKILKELYLTELSQIDLVIEAVPEDLELKRRLRNELLEFLSPNCLWVSTTSSLLASELATPFDDAYSLDETQFHIDHGSLDQQVLAMHFYPYPRTPVEIMGHELTPQRYLHALTEYAISLGLQPYALKKESRGFIFNRIWQAIKRESLSVIAEGVADHRDIDRLWMQILGAEIGPCGLMDMVGLDTVLNIAQIYLDRTSRLFEEESEASLNPDFYVEALLPYIQDNQLGVKSGQGFYSYPNPEFRSPQFTNCSKASPSSVTLRSLLGSWILVSMKMSTSSGEEFSPLGLNPKGVLMYHSNGRMSVCLERDEREKIDAADPLALTPDQAHLQSQNSFYYFGTYVLKANTIHHQITHSSFSPWINTTQVRSAAYNEEGNLVLTSEVYQTDSGAVVYSLVWKKE